MHGEGGGRNEVGGGVTREGREVQDSGDEGVKTYTPPGAIVAPWQEADSAHIPPALIKTLRGGAAENGGETDTR